MALNLARLAVAAVVALCLVGRSHGAAGTAVVVALADPEVRRSPTDATVVRGRPWTAATNILAVTITASTDSEVTAATVVAEIRPKSAAAADPALASLSLARKSPSSRQQGGAATDPWITVFTASFNVSSFATVGEHVVLLPAATLPGVPSASASFWVQNPAVGYTLAIKYPRNTLISNELFTPVFYRAGPSATLQIRAETTCMDFNCGFPKGYQTPANISVLDDASGALVRGAGGFFGPVSSYLNATVMEPAVFAGLTAGKTYRLQIRTPFPPAASGVSLEGYSFVPMDLRSSPGSLAVRVNNTFSMPDEFQTALVVHTFDGGMALPFSVLVSTNNQTDYILGNVGVTILDSNDPTNALVLGECDFGEDVEMVPARACKLEERGRRMSWSVSLSAMNPSLGRIPVGATSRKIQIRVTSGGVTLKTQDLVIYRVLDTSKKPNCGSTSRFPRVIYAQPALPQYLPGPGEPRLSSPVPPIQCVWDVADDYDGTVRIELVNNATNQVRVLASNAATLLSSAPVRYDDPIDGSAAGVYFIRAVSPLKNGSVLYSDYPVFMEIRPFAGRYAPRNPLYMRATLGLTDSMWFSVWTNDLDFGGYVTLTLDIAPGSKFPLAVQAGNYLVDYPYGNFATNPGLLVLNGSAYSGPRYADPATSWKQPIKGYEFDETLKKLCDTPSSALPGCQGQLGINPYRKTERIEWIFGVWTPEGATSSKWRLANYIKFTTAQLLNGLPRNGILFTADYKPVYVSLTGDGIGPDGGANGPTELTVPGGGGVEKPRSVGVQLDASVYSAIPLAFLGLAFIM
jgi:hypothetical protein